MQDKKWFTHEYQANLDLPRLSVIRSDEHATPRRRPIPLYRFMFSSYPDSALPLVHVVHKSTAHLTSRHSPRRNRPTPSKRMRSLGIMIIIITVLVVVIVLSFLIHFVYLQRDKTHAGPVSFPASAGGSKTKVFFSCRWMRFMRGDAVAPGEQAKSPVMEWGYVSGFLGSAKLSYVDILRGLSSCLLFSEG